MFSKTKINLKPDDQGYSRENIMKTLNFEQMEQVNGGFFSSWGTAICVGHSAGAIIGGAGVKLGLVAAASGPLGWAMLAVSAACLVYSFS